jgi:hypothetical protein
MERSAALFFYQIGGCNGEVCMKAIFVTALTLALSASAAWANNSVPLAPGKPAGLQQAQLEGGTGMLVVAGAALVGITIGLATASDSASQPTTTGPSTTSTSTTGTSP